MLRQCQRRRVSHLSRISKTVVQRRSLPCTPQRLSDSERLLLEELVSHITRTKPVNTLEDWYCVSLKDAPQKCYYLVVKHGFYNLLRIRYPTHQWKPWKFVKTRKGWWKHLENQKLFLKDFEEAHGISKLEDWYRVKNIDIRKYGGSALLNLYRSSLQLLLRTVYPHHEWNDRKFGRVSRLRLEDESSVKELMDDIAKELGITSLDQWYSITREQFLAVSSGPTIIRRFGSLKKALMALYPDHKWEQWKFVRISKNYWKDIRAVRNCLESLGKTLNVTELSDWYNVSYRDVVSLGGNTLLHSTGGSLAATLKLAFPEHNWEPWRFRSSKNGWSDTQQLREYFDQLAPKLGIKTKEDWYSIRAKDLQSLHGKTILKNFGYHIYNALATAYPEHKFLPWKFVHKPKNFFKSKKNVEEFAHWIADELNFKNMEDWYSFRWKDCIDLGITKVITEVASSPAKLVMKAFPEHNWERWRFVGQKTREFIGDSESLVKFVESLRTELQLPAQLDSWYRVSVQDLSPRIQHIIRKWGGLIRMLSIVYPQHEWDASKFVRVETRKKSQAAIGNGLRKLYPNENIKEEAVIMYVENLGDIVVDFLLPELHLAVEYQGENHYFDQLWYGNVSSQTQADVMKAAICATSGISLVEIPYWGQLNQNTLHLVISRLNKAKC